MEQKETSKRNNGKKKIASTTMPIRVRKETAKELRRQIAGANKKNYGRKIKADDLVAKGLSLLTEKHIQEVQESTLSNADKMEKKYREICSQKGHISRDEFTGMLMRGEVTFETTVYSSPDRESA